MIDIFCIHWITGKTLHTPYSTVLFRMTLNEPECLSKFFLNFNDESGISATTELLVPVAKLSKTSKAI